MRDYDEYDNFIDGVFSIYANVELLFSEYEVGIITDSEGIINDSGNEVTFDDNKYLYLLKHKLFLTTKSNLNKSMVRF